MDFVFAYETNGRDDVDTVYVMCTMRVRVRDFSMGNVDNGAMSRHEMYV